MPSLTVVPKTAPPPKRKTLRATRAPEVLQCPRCEGREMIETVTGGAWRNGRITGGARAAICAACQRNGERVTVA